MRFDTPVYFRTETAGTYDESTGNYGADDIYEQKAYADITNTGTEVLNIIYGNITQNSLTIRTREFFDGLKMRIGDKVYHIDTRRRLHGLTTYIVSEVQ